MIIRTWCLVGMMCTMFLTPLWASQEKAGSQARSRGIHVLYREQNLERKLKAVIDGNKHIKYTSELSVVVYSSDVIVIGGVESQEDIKFISAAVKRLAPQLKQKLYVTVIHDKTNGVSRAKDRFLRIKARMALLEKVGWKAGRMRVIVYNGTIYLMGVTDTSIHEIEKLLSPWADKIIVIPGDSKNVRK